MYINGTDQGTFATASTAVRSAPPRITIGSLQYNTQFYTGSIDQVRIWNVVRTQVQIQASINNELRPANESSLVLIIRSTRLFPILSDAIL
ncbi:LamG-like jellyroll fold domain-containing protein [Terrimonas ginsenosidimutans]|uniref:LamG-like jellyroll fold domain-containing protein n=1 Tax=Terrimonas ginsenosidimutans TaxID=2908004 RepID=UPI003D79BD33